METELIENIAEDVLQKFIHITDGKVSNGFVGISKQLANVESWLCIGLTDEHIVGIWGMDGISKTVIANVLFKKLANNLMDGVFLKM